MFTIARNQAKCADLNINAFDLLIMQQVVNRKNERKVAQQHTLLIVEATYANGSSSTLDEKTKNVSDEKYG